MFLCEREVFRKESEKQVNLVNFLAQSISLFFILTLILKLVRRTLGRLKNENDFADYLYLILRHLSSTRVLLLF